jgi:hypothetical protein
VVDKNRPAKAAGAKRSPPSSSTANCHQDGAQDQCGGADDAQDGKGDALESKCAQVVEEGTHIELGADQGCKERARAERPSGDQRDTDEERAEKASVQ